MARSVFLALLGATLVVLAAASKRPEKCAKGGKLCNTPVAEVPGCCTLKNGLSFQTGSCDCKTCHLGTFRPGKCNCFCTAVFNPVCCNVNGKQMTKGNSCECGCAGGKVIKKGSCKVTGGCICTKEFENTCCKRKKDGKLFQASNRCTCECVGSIIGPGQCPKKTCADVKCANCVDTIKGPRCGVVSPQPTNTPPKITCANILCGPGTPCCIETSSGPKCVKKSGKNCPKPDVPAPLPPLSGCAITICSPETPFCIDTPSGAKCVKKPATSLPPLSGCAITICSPETPFCIDTPSGAKCVKKPAASPPPLSTCAATICSTRTPCCVETPNGPKCVKKDDKRCSKPPQECPCPKILDPVCCKTKEGRLFGAPNKCTCECKGTVLGSGKCPKVTCANVLCRWRCIDTIKGPKCLPKDACHKVKCSNAKRPCCITTKSGPKCVDRQHKKCPTRITCETVKCTREHPCCIETGKFPKCVRSDHQLCRRP